jgi:hypothetical protein
LPGGGRRFAALPAGARTPLAFGSLRGRFAALPQAAALSKSRRSVRLATR